MLKPKVCVLITDGTNCDEELAYAFEKFGGQAISVHVNELRNKNKKFKDFQILALPGGFAYGDDVASGKILAVELISFLKDQLTEYINKGGLIIGICNGFQVLVRAGLLPFNSFGKMEATLAQNDSGHFECRWVNIRTEKSRCLFLKPKTTLVQFAINHGEGRFYANPKTIARVEHSELVVFRYTDKFGKPTQTYPANPNGSINAVAGICDLSGRILGLMPHPEKFVDPTQHPNWRRQKFEKPHGSFVFEEILEYVRGS